jgi:hypothetical protein
MVFIEFSIDLPGEMSGLNGRIDGRRTPDDNAAMQHYSYAQNDEVFANLCFLAYLGPAITAAARLSCRHPTHAIHNPHDHRHFL